MTSPFSLDGKIVLVTGASSGIGRAIAVAVAQMGGRVIASGRNAERLAETVGMLAGSGHASIAGDLTDPAQRAAVAASAPKLDGLVHSAGITALVPFHYISEKHLDQLHQINYRAPVLLTQMLLKNKSIADHGSIVFVASTAGVVGAKAIGAYAGTKGALIASARCLALEVAPRGVRVNCLAPALVETPMMEQTSAAVSAETFAENHKLYPLGIGKPEDVAHAAVFLLSQASRWITGATMILDGGCTIQ